MKFTVKRQSIISLMVLLSLLVLSTSSFAQGRQRRTVSNCQANNTYTSNYRQNDRDRNYRDYDRDRDRDYDRDRDRDSRYDDARYDRNNRDYRYDDRDYRYDDREYDKGPSRTKHLAIGAVAGAVGGAVIGGKKGALIGAGAGAGLGYIIYKKKK